MLGAAENDGQLLLGGVGLAAEQLVEQRALVLTGHETHLLVDILGGGGFRHDTEMCRFTQDGPGEFHNVRSEGGGKEQRLALGGQHRHDALDVTQKAHVQHPVHLVEHEKFHLAEVDVALVN